MTVLYPNSIRQHDKVYPTLRSMARDYLAIQGSATPAERAFSSGGLTGTKLRNRLGTGVFEGLQILKSGYRNGHISAASQAAGHLEALIAGLDDREFSLCASETEETQEIATQ